MSDKNELWKKALHVQAHAYAPYSKFMVGVAILAENGKIYAGCNVENSSYGVAICAERSAISAMISDGATEIKEVMIVTDTPKGCPPCGACRQAISEFVKDFKSVKIHFANTKGIVQTVSFSELLPFAFTESYLS